MDCFSRPDPTSTDGNNRVGGWVGGEGGWRGRVSGLIG